MASAGVLGASGMGCLTESIDDVALCFTLTDLLRQGLEAAPGCGIAEEVLLLAGLELQPLSRGAGAFSLIPGWEEAGLANGSFSWLLGGGGGRIRKAVSCVSERHLLFSPLHSTHFY